MLFALLAVTALAVMWQRNLFTATMLLGLFSLLSASLFVVMDAVDVAFTEAAVGAGVSTILMLATLGITGCARAMPFQHSLPRLLAVVLTGALLIYGTLDMPHYGDPDAPAMQHVVPRYVEASGTEIGIPNIVTSVLASYRGYDTLGETSVIFCAGIAVLMLLKGRRARKGAGKPGKGGKA